MGTLIKCCLLRYYNPNIHFHVETKRLMVSSNASICKSSSFQMVNNVSNQKLSKNSPVCYTQKRNMLKHSINHIVNKKVLDRYMRLPLPCSKVLATYVWIDGSGINMRCKDRVLKVAPTSAETAPKWAFDGSSCGLAQTDSSDTRLDPVVVYRDPFRADPHVIVLCQVFVGDSSTPAATNNRKYCNDLLEFHKGEDPWFGIEQEYTMMDMDGWGLGWPKGGGFPSWKYQYSYCGVGAKYTAGRDVAEAHTKASLFAGCDLEGTNAEVCFASWEWQVGTTPGIKAPDDMWMTRFIMARVAEDYGVDVTYHPKPFGMMHPGIGMHHNFSSNSTRGEGGFEFIKKCIKSLEKNHMKHMKNYSNEVWTNKLRMSGKFETANFNKFSWGIANRAASIRLQRNIKKKGKGYMEDRRPGGDGDPYLICGLITETCLGPVGGGKCNDPCKPKDPCKR